MRSPPAIAFLGPSLPATEARRLFPGLQVRGPARQGDVLRALRAKPRAIVLIDGVFESQPSVWHQELLIALAEGVTLLGASSMGALRAAELARFGMIGVGAIYQAYAGHHLTDDADVALLHASAEHQYRPLTVPLVNVIATAELALERGFLRRSEARALVDAARQIHYQDRGWPQVIHRLRWPERRRQAFDAFRRSHPRDVKAEDARECMKTARELCRERPRTAPQPHASLSVWARRAWLREQGDAPARDGTSGLRTLLLADWARSAGLRPDPDRVAELLSAAPGIGLDRGLAHRFAEAIALEEQVLRQPGLMHARAPSLSEGQWLEALRGTTQRRRAPGSR